MHNERFLFRTDWYSNNIINDMNTNLTFLVVNNTNYKSEEVHVN